MKTNRIDHALLALMAIALAALLITGGATIAARKPAVSAPPRTGG